MIKKVILFLIVLIVVLFIKPICMKLQIPLYDLLIQVSSIILAISGAWIAIIFPKSFKNILLYKKDYSQDFEAINLLIQVTIGSFYILIITLFIKLSGLILYHIDCLLTYKIYIQKLSLLVLILLYLYEIQIILMIILPIKNIFNKARKENTKNGIIDKKHGNLDREI